ncbi:hypothetical protein OIO89_01055 (plasmid) [Mycobacterium ulcerans]|nr:hypothetical protein OIO89_01055 [Mycobacterium ulcerans]
MVSLAHSGGGPVSPDAVIGHSQGESPRHMWPEP